MKIDRKKGIKVKVQFDDIPCGEVFEYKEVLFIKAGKMSKHEDIVVAMNIRNGCLTAFSKYTPVHPVQAKVVVDE